MLLIIRLRRRTLRPPPSEEDNHEEGPHSKPQSFSCHNLYSCIPGRAPTRRVQPCRDPDTCRKNSNTCEQASGSGATGTTAQAPGIESSSRPSAGEKCCSSEAPTVARLLAGCRTFSPPCELVAAMKGL